MGLKHEAKKGTVIEANGVKVTVLRGNPKLEISAPSGVVIAIRASKGKSSGMKSQLGGKS